MVRYRARRGDDAAVRMRLRALAGERRRLGFRRFGVLLACEGVVLNHKKLRRWCGQGKFQVRRRAGRKRAVGTRAPLVQAAAPIPRWSLDFVSDTLADGRRLRVLCVVDDCTRESLALVADVSLSGQRAVRELNAIAVERGYPDAMVSDNGTELTRMAILAWAKQHDVALHYIASGNLQQNGCVGSFTGSCVTSV